MSGPSEPTQWASNPQGQQPEQEHAGSDAPTVHGAQWQQPPSYTPPQYPSYEPPAYTAPTTPPYQSPATDYPAQSYPSTEQYGQQPGQYGQYGQPAQYGQPQPDYGQSGQYGQPGQYGPYASTATAQGSKRSKALMWGLIGGAAVIIIAVGVTAFAWPAWAVTTKLDVAKVQDGVTHILTDDKDGYGAKNVTGVKCNTEQNGQNPTVKKNGTFTCDVSIDGTARQVTVTMTDDKGTYEVGRPRTK